MSEQTITLSDNISSYQVGYAPLTLTLNPSGFSTIGGPIIKIEYDFDDASKSIIVNRLLNTTNLSGTAYPNDLGDPRNVPVVHTLIPSASSDPQLYNIKVKVTRGNTFTPTLYTLPLYVYKVNALDGAAQGYFEDIHIINSRVFGADNNKIYTFETVNPRYITFLSHSNKTIANIGNVKILHITYQTTSNNAGYRLLPLDNIITDNDILGNYVIDFRLKNNGNTTLTISSVSCDNITQFQPISFNSTTLQSGEYTTVSLSAIPPDNGSINNILNGVIYIHSDVETRIIDISIEYKQGLEYISWLMNDTDNSKVQDVSNLGYTLNLTTIYKQPTPATQCRYKALNATMVGFDENPGYASTPPKKYRENTISGTSSVIISPSGWKNVVVWSGTAKYNKTTGLVTSYATACWNSGYCDSAKLELCKFGPGSASVQWYTFYDSATHRYSYATAWDPSGADQYPCACPVSLDKGYRNWTYGSDSMSSSGTINGNYSDEDTEADAEARAVNAVQDWTGPESDSCQVASFRTDRGNTFSWSATQVQHRAQVPDYNPDNPDAEYEVDLWYVVTEGLMSDRWVTEGFHTVTKKPAGPGDNWTEWVDIPIPEVGFFAWHMGCRVRVHNAGS